MKVKFNGVMEIPDDEVATLFGSAGPPVATSSEEPAAEPAAKPKRGGKPPSLNSLKKKAVKMTNEGLVDELRAILKEFGIKQVAQLEESSYIEFSEALDKAIAEGPAEDDDG